MGSTQQLFLVFIYLFIYLYIYLFIYLFIYLYIFIFGIYLSGIYMFKVDNKNPRTRHETCLKLILKNKYQNDIVKWCSVVFIVNFERISYLVLVFLLLTLNI